MLRLSPVQIAMLTVGVLALGVALVWLILASPRKSDVTTSLSATPSALVSPASVAKPTTLPPTFRITPRPLPDNAPLGYGVVTSRSLNLRAEPSTQATVLGELKFSELVALTRRDGGWYQTTEGSWVSALYLEVRQTKAEAQSYASELLQN